MRCSPALPLVLLLASTAAARPVQVVDRGGRPVQGALVSSREPGGEASRTDAEGRSEAPAGALRVEAPGFLPLDGVEGDRLVLTRPSAIRVRAVSRSTGEPVDSARVRAWRKAEDEDAEELLVEPPAEPALVETQLSAGTARLEGLASGAYRVLIEAPGFLSSAEAAAPGPEAEDELLVRLVEAHVVEGRVLADGRPVPEARVLALPALPEMNRRFRGGGGPGRLAWARLGREVRTDARGAFRHDQIPADRRLPFLLIAQAPDLRWGLAVAPATRFGATPGESSAESRTIRLDVEVTKGQAVEGLAVWSDGEPAAGVPVVAEWEQESGGFGRLQRFGVPLGEAFQEWGGGPEAATGPEGAFRIRGLPPGNWRILARPFEHAPSEPATVALVAGGAAPEPVTLEISRGLKIEGLVVDPAGNPIEGAEVAGERRGPGERWPEQVLETTSDGKGRFLLSGFEPGVVSLRVSAHGFADERYEVGDLSEVGPQRVVLTRTGRLFGTVINAATGEPVTRFRVQAVRAEEDPESGRSRFVGRNRGTEITSEDGEFELEEVEEGRWAVLVRADGFLSRAGEPADVRAGEASDAGRIELMPGATLEGVVIDAETSEPIEGATVTVEGFGGRSGFGGGRFGRRTGDEAPSDTSGPEGGFRLDGLPPGEFTIRASHHLYPVRGAHGQRVSVSEDPTAVMPALTIELERGGAVSGRVLDPGGEPVPGALVVVTEPGSRGRGSMLAGPVEADAEGAFYLEALPVGEVQVRRVDRMDGGVDAQVRKGEVVEVVLQDVGARVFGAVLVGGRPVEAKVRLLAGSWAAPRSDWGSSYELLGVPAGEWQVRVEIRDPADPTAPVRDERVVLVVPEGVREFQKDLDLEPEDTSDDVWVEGRVVDAELGEGLEGWLVSARSPGHPAETTRTDERGSYRVLVRESGEWTLSAMGLGEDANVYDSPPTQTIVAENGRLANPPSDFEAWRRFGLAVRVVDVAGAPVAGATCMLVNKAEHLSPQTGLRLFGPRAVQTDALGRARPTAGDEGQQDLVVILPTRAFVLRPGVRVGGGEVEVRLPRTGSIEIRGASVADLLGLPNGWWMRVRAGQARYGLLETVGDTLWIHGLPAGNYQVRVESEMRDAEVVPGTVGTVVDFGS